MFAPRTTRRAFVGLGGATLAWTMAQPTPAARVPRAQTAPPAELTGRVIWPGDPEYEAARRGFNRRFSRFPAAIVVCGSVADVQNAVRWARQEDMNLRARSGGHSYEGYSVVDDGLVIDVGGLSDITVDVAGGQAVVGAGVRLLEIYRRLGAHGVTIPAGTCPLVGIAGLTLGGGIGFLSRQYGLTCDNLLAVDLVDAAGDVLRARETEHADLFWGLRGGGGGNFGIATAFTFRVHPIDDVAVFSLAWPWEDVAEVLDGWQRWAPFVDERLTAGFVVPDPSAGVVVSSGQFSGSAAELESLLAPLLAVGTPDPPRIRTVPYLAAVEEFAGTPITESTFKNTGAFVAEPLSAEAIATFVTHMRASPTTANLVGFFPAGGAIAAVDPAATAFVHRDALFDMQYQAYWWDPADEQTDVAWVRDLRTAMEPSTSGDYVNYIDVDISDWATAYYGANLPRLKRVKATYDPDDVFNGPQSIPQS
jgi:FAD/FMN-containing dehydrogenase